ncbi:MAG: hypothetical protein O7H41_19140 [Planctomycetota bacterium]|nr:hypothetical protein [Planctomycetota bacterium]
MPKLFDSDRQRGSMLIVAMGVLTLITLLGVTFLLLMSLEKKVANAYVDRVESRILSKMGVDAVVGQLKQGEILRSFSDPKSVFTFNRGRDGMADLTTAVEDLDPKKTSLYREVFPKYEDGVNRVRTKVIPANAMININDHHPTLAIMLEALGSVIAHEREVDNPIPRGAGDKLLLVRDNIYGGRFNSKVQLREAIGSERYRLVKDFLTADSWVDPAALMPALDTITNPSTSVARGQVQFVRPEDAAPIQSDLLQIGGRAPININEAPLEVLAAAIMPIGGRRAYHAIPSIPNRFPIDQNRSGDGGVGHLRDFLEEGVDSFANLYYRKTRTSSWQPYQWVFFPPYYLQANGVERAIRLARAIIKERNGETYAAGRSKGPFQSVMDFENWVEQLPNTDIYFLPTQVTEIPTENALGQWGPIRGHADYPRFHYESIKSMIKANFNPNGLINSFNPSSAAWRPVDKGNLLYPMPEQIDKLDLTSGRSASVGDFISCQSVDFCYAPMGVYEITSVGEVSGAQDTDLPPGKDRKIYGMTKVRTVVKMMGVIRHTTQRDFERNDNLYNSSNRKRNFVRSYPENDIFWEPGDGSGRESAGHGGDAATKYGHIELDTSLSRGSEPRSKPALTKGPGSTSRPQPLFEALFDKRDRNASSGRFLMNDALRATRAGGGIANPRQPMAEPYGTAAWRSHDSNIGPVGNFVLAGGVQYPDGIRSSLAAEGKGTTGDPRTLWYRAASATVDPAAQGISRTDGEVNLEMFKGSLEFWYKPDFDWSFWDDRNRSPIEANPLFCGLFQSTHVQLNPLVEAGSVTGSRGKPTRVVQMFVFRNTLGDLRIVRLYSEVTGLDTGTAGGDDQHPLLKNPDTSGLYPDPMTISQYIEANQGVNGSTWKWPPDDLEILQHLAGSPVTYAREDFVVPYDDLRFWRAHEWHHIALVWDDAGGNGKQAPQDYIRVFIDGKPVSIAQRINFWLRGDKGGLSEDAGEFVRLNHYPVPGQNPNRPNDPIAKDSMYIGCIHRPQMAEDGIFKFDKEVTFGSNGTIDDVRTFKEAIIERMQVARPTDRFVAGVYEQRFDIPFPGNVKRLRLGTLTFTAYMPKEYNDADANKIRGARIEITVLKGDRPLQGFTGGGRQFSDGFLEGGIPLTQNLRPEGKPVYLQKGEPLTYRVRMYPGQNSLGNVATPVLDDITLTYFLPKTEVLSQEEILD